VELSDTVLIARVLSFDDRHAFAELVKRHQSMLRGFLRRVSGDAFLADDLAQEAFVEAYRNLGKFGGQSEFSTWLLGIGYNRFRQWRRKKREVEIPENMPEAADERADAEARGTAADVRAAIAKLNAEQRTALDLCYGQGLSHDEAAKVLGCPLGTIKSNILRAREKLKGYLAAYSANA
jgi:RNA polymerase sigma-70 factor, ECF subfamily